MKKYYEVRIPCIKGAETGEIVMALLAGLGYQGFLEEDDHLLAYLPVEDFNRDDLNHVLASLSLSGFEINEIADRNWNKIWESDYEAVLIDNSILVRAPFHEAALGIVHDIIIEPKMSFGTAHHETTYMMLSLIFRLDVKMKSVLDMGCGTAVLALLAYKMGAGDILAIDNDEWAYQNARENVLMNNAGNISVLKGDAAAFDKQHFDIIFANINRNILLKDIPTYASALESGGSLLMSGFYADDLDRIIARSEESGLRLTETSIRNNWMATVFISDKADD
ncbi:MAG: 50S ribosomal protein L11 methyltransferase [Bacteroidetes bacterium]|nr:50S ribosomal protein L11 methyltransferase [Bacteroidota bacterium]